MCGIFGFFNFENSLEETFNAMKKISYRGKDSCGLFFDDKIIISESLKELQKKVKGKKSDFAMGHLLHSIVDFVPMPIEDEKGVLIANCEIYNWEFLNEKYKFGAKNDSEVLLGLLGLKGIGNISGVLDELDGSYSFAYLDKKLNKVVLARDVLGIKPLWYFFDEKEKKFAFASENKVLPTGSLELNPRSFVIFDLDNFALKDFDRIFSYDLNELDYDYDRIKKETKDLLFKAIRKRIPKNQKIGVLFSGGIDSTFVAYVLKELGVDFTCYTAKALGGNIKEASDLIYGREIAEKYGFDFKVAEVSTEDLEREVKEVVALVEDREYIKVSVALPFYLACKNAREDGVKVIFSGLGSEEIFAGYRRHRIVDDINLECFKGLLSLHKRDLYRDDVVTMSQNIEIRLPFLDRELIGYCMRIPDKYKLSEDKMRNKIVLRDIAKEMGLDEKYAERAKKAAQYGSKFDKGLLRLAKDAGVGKQEYLDKLDLD